MIGQPSQAGKIDPEVVRQGENWWDITGRRHRIATMDYDYALNVIEFCHQHPRLRHDFPFSVLSDALRARLFDAFEKAHKYEDLCK